MKERVDVDSGKDCDEKAYGDADKGFEEGL